MVPKLVNLGSLCVDHVYRVPALVNAGETVASLSHQIYPGGKGLNQSLAAARAGARVHHVGCVGHDGAMLKEVLDGAGVQTGAIRVREDLSSGHAVIQVNDRGENAIVIAGGCNRVLEAADFAAARGLLEADDWLLLQNEINDLQDALRLTAGTGARLALNLAPVDGEVADLDLGGVDLLIVNELEARALVPEAVRAEDDLSMARRLAGRFPDMSVVLTSGAAGLVYAEARLQAGAASDAHAAQHLPAFTVSAVDETAAGDAFIGYLLTGLLAGRPLGDALRWASAAGALAVTREGAASSIPERSAVDALTR